MSPGKGRFLVAGAGVAGAAAARALLEAGAQVTVVDRRDGPALAELAGLGARTVITGEPDPALLDGIDELVVSPGFAPHHPLVGAALDAGLEIYSEPELAWRMRGPGAPPWLAVTGTNGKTTTVTMLAAILRAAGLRTAALGNIGEPLVSATGYDVLAVELSSFQLHWSRDLAPHAGALLNVDKDHLDWHGSMCAYATAKKAIWRGAADGTGVALGNLDDRWVSTTLGDQPGRPVGWTVGRPAPGQFGVLDGMLVEHPADGGDPVELIEASRVRPAGAHNVSNALAAAALASTHGVRPAAIRAGLAGYQPEGHRNAPVATVGGVDYVDDSKATNPHAARASLTSYPRVVWVAGGQLKGVLVDDLVAEIAPILAGAVLLGTDRHLIRAALERHAGHVPMIEVARTDDGAMAEVVRAAAGLARPGDTVLLAPAAASLDMYTGYAQRGDAFAAAVAGLAAATPDPASGPGVRPDPASGPGVPPRAA